MSLVRVITLISLGASLFLASPAFAVSEWNAVSYRPLYGREKGVTYALRWKGQGQALACEASRRGTPATRGNRSSVAMSANAKAIWNRVQSSACAAVADSLNQHRTEIAAMLRSGKGGPSLSNRRSGWLKIAGASAAVVEGFARMPMGRICVRTPSSAGGKTCADRKESEATRLAGAIEDRVTIALRTKYGR